MIRRGPNNVVYTLVKTIKISLTEFLHRVVDYCLTTVKLIQNREIGWKTVDRRTGREQREQQLIWKKLKLFILFSRLVMSPMLCAYGSMKRQVKLVRGESAELFGKSSDIEQAKRKGPKHLPSRSRPLLISIISI